MISVDTAIKIVEDTIRPLPVITIPFENALGFCLAQDVYSDIDMPPFDRSAMDGYAVIAEDTTPAPVELTVIEDIAAGHMPTKTISRGQASKIMTGAAVPKGADAVVKFEETEDLSANSRVKILRSIDRGRNISSRGEDMQVGQTVLRKNMLIRPQEIGILATVGKSHVEVFAAPTIGIISTGDELVNVGMKPSAAQIRNSNGYSLAAQSRSMRTDVELLGIVKDTKEEISKMMCRGFRKDILILSGGVSMGEYDLVGDVMKDLNTQIYFEKVALRPGKPVIFGKKDKTFIFALPGNPVASFVTFELFIYPAIRKMMGFPNIHRTTVKASLEMEILVKRKRREYRPALLRMHNNAWLVSPVEWHGSADLLATTMANCLLIVREDAEKLMAGDLVDVISLD
ncbi:Molybdopterin molybdenumtransferase [Candidatus Brocadiaceae bacterium B188]|nr:molybdopterin molybdotransferase MoeA [Candidatus Brocadia sapporoensis]QQR66424.1 MAG: molybdopterin molybdotransferase MoeA [Candidatus Brocadia sp.]RZV58736.1 MAG: molybdopterin molybdenumtransferase MoeA [Candidatus Brocadia sp. BROELEC01]TWU53380.1 Molybdopterin molybdenumtransferase [Candidatus Brocadiaceae bacterium B188]